MTIAPAGAKLLAMMLRVVLREARSILLDRMPSLVECVSGAVSTWNTDYAPHHLVLDATARAKILSDHFYFNAASSLSGRGVELKVDQLQRYLVVDERLILRFKRFDGHLGTRNYPTDHATEWVRQIPLDGIPPVARLHLGYRLDLTGTILEDMFVTLPNGIPEVVNDWVWQVWGEPITTVGIQMRFPQLQPDAGVVYAYDDFSARSS